MDEVIPATTREHFRAFATLMREYVEWCREKYSGDTWFIDAVVGNQSLEEELQELSSLYGLPNGRAFLARSGDEIVGCIAYQRLSDTICQMKRLFVRPAAQGHGTGRRLCLAAIDAARNDGYDLMRLDAANFLTDAIALYRSIGFRDRPANNDYPDDFLPYIVFMEMPLAAAPAE
jgi:GNAT superfamily N-acetyltransferase